MGRQIYYDLILVDINVFVTDEIDVDRAIDLYMNNSMVDQSELACHHEYEGIYKLNLTSIR